MQYRRILAVGDIHGMYKKLIALMDMVRFNPLRISWYSSAITSIADPSRWVALIM